MGAMGIIIMYVTRSWKFDFAAEMVSLSKELDFAFMAGSSLPTAWRMPPVRLVIYHLLQL